MLFKPTRYSTLALLTALAAAPAAVGGLDVTYSEITFTGEAEMPDWEITNVDTYTISPAGNVAYRGGAFNTVTFASRSITWVDPVEYLPSGQQQYNNRQRLLTTGDQILNAAGTLVTVLSPGEPHVSDNDMGSGTPAPIVFAEASITPPSVPGDTFCSWTGLATALTRNPMIDTGVGTAGGFTVQGIDSRMRASGSGGSLITRVAITGPSLPGGAADAVVTFEAPASAPELVLYQGLAVPGGVAPNAAYSGQVNYGYYTNAHRDAIVTTQFTSDTGGGEVISYFDHSTSALSTVAYTGLAAPGRPGNTYDNTLTPLGLNNSGQFVFVGALDNSEVGLWADKQDGAGVQLLIGAGDQAPVLDDPALTVQPWTFGPGSSAALLSESGKFFFFADLFDTNYDSTALYLGDLNGDYKLIVRSGDPVIGVEGATFSNGFPDLGTVKGPNVNGRVTFRNNISIPGVGTRTGIFLTDAEDRPHLIAIDGDGFLLYAGDGPGTVFYRASSVSMPQIADAGMMVYLAESNQSSSTFYLFCTSVDLFGDIDKDGVRDAADIDALAAAINAGSILAKWDMNNDNSVDSDDFDYWVGPIAMTVPGDVDLDGDVDDTDVGAIIANFTGPGGTGQGWADGDTDGDGDIDDTDLGTAISNFTGPL